jgi:hypothetical protein
MVVVFTILFENAAKVVFIQDQDMVQTLLSNRTHPPFSNGVSLGFEEKFLAATWCTVS